MIVMPVPKDIRAMKPKFIGPLTKPQFTSFVIAGGIAIVVNALIGRFLPQEILLLIIVAEAVPIVACGFIEINGLPLYVYMKDVVITKLFSPKVLVFDTKNIYAKYAIRNRITYEYFEGDTKAYTVKERKKKDKLNEKHFKEYLKKHPEMAGIK